MVEQNKLNKLEKIAGAQFHITTYSYKNGADVNKDHKKTIKSKLIRNKYSICTQRE